MLETSATDSFEPIDLDDNPKPTPDLARWTELAELPGYVDHDGDASAVIPLPRPLWSEYDYDDVGTSLMSTFYRSAMAHVIASRARGYKNNAQWIPATVAARVKMDGDGITSVTLALNTFDPKVGPTGGWQDLALSLTPTEAHDVAEMLLAAAALAVSE